MSEFEADADCLTNVCPIFLRSICERLGIAVETATRMATPKSCEAVFFCASFGISGASSKNEWPRPSETDLRILEAHGCLTPWKSVWTQPYSPVFSVSKMPFMPRYRDGAL